MSFMSSRAAPSIPAALDVSKMQTIDGMRTCLALTVSKHVHVESKLLSLLAVEAEWADLQSQPSGGGQSCGSVIGLSFVPSADPLQNPMRGAHGYTCFRGAQQPTTDKGTRPG